ncbi:MAG: SAM-dependent methyltransferase [Paludibacteraceae bacterium]|nr:SAM-dependent methyltransferase [Paludibacteraceae bacterium]
MTTKEYIKLHRKDDVYKLALGKAPEGVDLQHALQQIAAYQTIEKKIPSWAECDDLVFPPKLSLEQSSSELTAQYKAQLIKEFMGGDGFTHIDLTGGMGIDCYFIAQNANASHYVEQNADLCHIAQHNFTHLNPNIRVHNTTAEEFLNQITDNRVQSTDNNPSFLIYLDPARRGNHGEKLVSISDCQPDVVALLPQMFEITDKVVVKLSPMLDITRAISELEHIEHLYVISVGNECKELLLFINRNYNAETQIHAINLKSTVNGQLFSGYLSHESALSLAYAREVGRYIYEPYAAHLKSGLYKTIAETYGVEKLHQHSHLYTSMELNSEFPGRHFAVEQVVPFDKKSAKSLFKSLKQANITTRNFPLAVSELRTQYKIKEGGATYIFATTLYDNSKVLIVCSK